MSKHVHEVRTTEGENNQIKAEKWRDGFHYLIFYLTPQPRN